VQKRRFVKEKKTVLREAPSCSCRDAANTHSLTKEQQDAVDAITMGFHKVKPLSCCRITGSGKTHVYIELAKRALAMAGALSSLCRNLTHAQPSPVQEALGDVIAVIHSRMSDGERRDSLDELVTAASGSP